MKIPKLKKSYQKYLAQATIEFTFSMVIATLLLLGMVHVLVWSGQDLVDRRHAHETFLPDDTQSGVDQTRPTLFYASPIAATVTSNLFGSAFE